MANFRSTADYIDSILLLVGEPTNGNSAFEARALAYLNQVQNAIVGGGNEFNVEVDEVWPWAVARDPIIIDMLPKYETGTVALTKDSTALTFSSAPAISLKDYHIKFKDSALTGIYKIVSHTAASASATIEAPFDGTSVTAQTYQAVKLDYEIIPGYVNITTDNNKIPFTEATAGTELTATLTVGSYLIAALLTELDTQMDAAGASAYTSTYNSVTRKFTITSDLAGADNLFSILGASGTEASIYASALPTLGLGLKDHTGSAAYTSERALGSISRIIMPFKIQTGSTRTDDIYGVDKTRFSTDYAISEVRQGNPTRFTVLEQRDDGYVKVRFNKYVKDESRVEVSYTPNPLDLYDNTKAHPMIPRRYSRLLYYGAASYLAGEKNDNRAQGYFQMAGAILESMMKNNHKDSERVGRHYGEIIAREDLLNNHRRRLIYGTPDEV